MRFTSIVTTGASLVLLVVANGCHQDNCYRALEHYQETSSASFCKQYLHTKYADHISQHHHLSKTSTNHSKQNQDRPIRHRNLRLFSYLQRLQLPYDYHPTPSHNDQQQQLRHVDLYTAVHRRLPHGIRPLLCLYLRRSSSSI
ncbi:hypothetical protein BDR22DRAFT_260537 [Usnea florida]